MAAFGIKINIGVNESSTKARLASEIQAAVNRAVSGKPITIKHFTAELNQADRSAIVTSLQNSINKANLKLQFKEIDASPALKKLQSELQSWFNMATTNGIAAGGASSGGSSAATDNMRKLKQETAEATAAMRELQQLQNQVNSAYRAAGKFEDQGAASGIISQYRQINVEIENTRRLTGQEKVEAVQALSERVNALQKTVAAQKELEKAAKTSGDATKEGLTLATKETKTFAQALEAGAAKLAAFFESAAVYTRMIKAVKEMVSSVRELDVAMTELRKVTDLTETQYSRFLNTAASMSKTIGASMTDMVNSTADFARLGFNLIDATSLAEAALVYKNVGDGIDDIQVATESLISTMKAFGDSIESPMRIVDMFNEVGNNFAISSAGIGEALQRSAAALSAAGNTIEESIGLITAMNNVVQNPQQVGTALKTLTLY